MDYISFIQYQEIMNCIQDQKYFEHKIEIEKIEISIHSSIAKCDWRQTGVKEGNYIICFNMNKKHGGQMGQGIPYSVTEFTEIFSCYQLLVRHVNDWILKNSDTVRIGASEQLSLF